MGIVIGGHPGFFLPADLFKPWLDPDNQDVEALRRMCTPWASDAFEALPVSTLVNSVHHDVLSCREPHVTNQAVLFDSI